MAEITFEEMTVEDQLLVCHQQITYWHKMRKQVIQKSKALTDEEKTAISGKMDLKLEKQPKTKKEKK